ncbi:peroxiredoxin [Acidisoma sp. S159]|uniref:peroxiredoxin n=1 Tax=Acidisoma sp. S159 TaxID=1747225 RepID=UPI00131E5C52|nr:peroxiredoxin [Acidisoma sp. S159]
MTGDNPPPRHGRPLLHDTAPEFKARTTLGDRQLSDYRGKWLLLFSHPADFTPVCTSEFVAFAAAFEQFQARNCELLALSVDSLFSHFGWIRSIHEQFGIKIPFPIIEDPSMAIAKAYGMVAPNAPDASMVRAAFVIDPEGIIRAMSWYPMTTGRNVAELLRLIAALQTSDSHGVSTPEAWQPGDDIILPLELTANTPYERHGHGADWYFRTGPLPPGSKPAARKAKT